MRSFRPFRLQGEVTLTREALAVRQSAEVKASLKNADEEEEMTVAVCRMEMRQLLSEGEMLDAPRRCRALLMAATLLLRQFRLPAIPNPIMAGI